MALLNYSTQIAVEKTVTEIQSILAYFMRLLRNSRGGYSGRACAHDNLVIRTVRGWLHRLVRYLSPPPSKQLQTTMDWLRDRLESTAFERWKSEAKATESDYWLTPFEAGVLFSDKPLPWAGSVDMWKADFGTLYLRVPSDLMDLSKRKELFA